jgi:thiamine pyrophosphokinase
MHETETRFAILLGGQVRPTARLAAQVKGARVIAADSGMAHAAPLGLVPELWVGDFDSASVALQADYATVPRLRFPSAKDVTDGEIAVEAALARGARRIILVGAFGGQFDHALAHATLLLSLQTRGVSAMASSGNEEAWPLLDSLLLPDLPPGAGLSVIGLTSLVGLSISGVRWPLETRDVPRGASLTLSNTVTGPVMLSLRQGEAVVVVYPTGETT